MSRGPFWKIIFFFTKPSKISFFFRLWGNVSDFWRKYSCWVVKTVFKCAGDIFESVFFWKQIPWIYSFFLVFGHKFLDFRRKFCDRFVKTAFYVSRGDFGLDCFLYKNFLSFLTVFGLWEKNSGFLAQKLQKNCQNFNLCVQKISVENLTFEKTFTIFSSTDQKICGLLSKNNE